MVSQFQYTNVRGSHLISPFGPGALQISHNGVCAIVCGPPVWLESIKNVRETGIAFDRQRVWDSHMEEPLGVERLVAPWPISENPSTQSDWFVPAARFPLYEYCINSKCHTLIRREASDYKEGRCDRCAKGRSRRWTTVQVPVVLACQVGHLSDLPWSEWLHGGESDCEFPDDLRFHPGSLPDQPSIECASCSLRRRLSSEDKFECTGERPWLPGLPNELCDRAPQVLERSSTAVYFAQTVSSLAVPPPGVDNPALVRKLRSSSAIRSQRRSYERDKSNASLEEIVRLCIEGGVPTFAEQVERHLAALDFERKEAEDRIQELDALLMSRPRPADGHGLPDLIVEPQFMGSYTKTALINGLSAVSLVPRLREVRVLTGFSRLRAREGRVPPNYEQLWGHPPPGKVGPGNSKSWFPAYEVFGEGILFQLNESVVSQWEDQLHELDRGELRALREEGKSRIFLLHSLSHTIMRAVAPYAGYPLPSLRERLFDSDGRLAVLIYTSAGDIQGTLGGLVELGRPGRLEGLLEEAVQSISWCTTDPVCFDAGVDLGLSRTTSPGACNHCLLLPETSCELSNKNLDRAAIIGFDGRASFSTSLSR